MEPDEAEWTSIGVERSSIGVDRTRWSGVEADGSGAKLGRCGVDSIGVEWNPTERSGPQLERNGAPWKWIALEGAEWSSIGVERSPIGVYWARWSGAEPDR
eukprot:3023558-Pleurochrysis_carterae.AAC.1